MIFIFFKYKACDNRGSFKKLDDGENLISKMSNYYEYLSSSTYSKEQGLWTSPYIGKIFTVYIR